MRILRILKNELKSQMRSDLSGLDTDFRDLKQNGLGRLKHIFAEDWHYSLFLLFMLLGAVEFYIYLNVSNGACLNDLIFNNPNDPFADMFMDFYNPVRSLYMDNPYTQIRAMYPPIVYIIISLFSGTIPVEGIVHDMTTFIDIDYPSLLVIRNSREAIFAYVMFSFVNICLFTAMVCHLLKKHGKKMSLLFALLIMFSYPYLYMFDRGQVLIITVNFLLFYFISRENESRLIQELGLVCFALAICTKIYPVFFSLLLLRERKFGQLLRAGVYSLMIFVLPFAFYGGFEAFKAIFINIFAITSDLSKYYPAGNFNIANCINALEMVNGWNSSLLKKLEDALPWLIIVFGSIACFFLGKTWKQVLIITCIFLMFPNTTMIYNGVLYVIPLIAFIAEKNKTKADYLFVFLFAMCFLSIPAVIFDIRSNLSIFDGPNLTVSYCLLSTASCSMTALLIGEGLYNALMLLMQRFFHSEERLDFLYFHEHGGYKKSDLFTFHGKRIELIKSNMLNTGILFLISYLVTFSTVLLDRQEPFGAVFDAVLTAMIPTIIVKMMLGYLLKSKVLSEKNIMNTFIFGVYIGIRYTLLCGIVIAAVGLFTGVTIHITLGSLFWVLVGIMMVPLLTVVMVLLIRLVTDSLKVFSTIAWSIFCLMTVTNAAIIAIGFINSKTQYFMGINPMFYLSTRFWTLLSEAPIKLYVGVHFEFWIFAFIAVLLCAALILIKNYKKHLQNKSDDINKQLLLNTNT